jgi:hypothetical protein
MYCPLEPFNRSLPFNPLSINASPSAGTAYTAAKNARMENPTHASSAGKAVGGGNGMCRRIGRLSVGDLRAAERSGWRMRDVAIGARVSGTTSGKVRGDIGGGLDAIVSVASPLEVNSGYRAEMWDEVNQVNIPKFHGHVLGPLAVRNSPAAESRS